MWSNCIPSRCWNVYAPKAKLRDNNILILQVSAIIDIFMIL